MADVFDILGRHVGAPQPPVSPLISGNPGEVRRLLDRDFALVFERGQDHAHHDDVGDIWDSYARGFGPMRQIVEERDDARRKALKAEVDAYHAHYAGEAGLHVTRDYLATIGRRR